MFFSPKNNNQLETVQIKYHYLHFELLWSVCCIVFSIIFFLCHISLSLHLMSSIFSFWLHSLLWCNMNIFFLSCDSCPVLILYLLHYVFFFTPFDSYDQFNLFHLLPFFRYLNLNNLNHKALENILFIFVDRCLIYLSTFWI